MPKTRGTDSHSNCSVEAALEVLGGRWKGVVLFWLLQKPHRFSDLQRRLPNCSPRMLTVQLRELEEDGLLTRTVFAEVPPRVEYAMTPFGRTLEPLLLSLRDWGGHLKAHRAAESAAEDRNDFSCKEQSA